MLFHILLDLLDQCVVPLFSGGEDDISLDQLSPDFIGNAHHGTFKDIGQFHKNAFHLKGTDAVSGALDQIVGTPHIPVVAVLIFPGGIAGVVESVVPAFVGLFLVAVVA